MPQGLALTKETEEDVHFDVDSETFEQDVNLLADSARSLEDDPLLKSDRAWTLDQLKTEIIKANSKPTVRTLTTQFREERRQL